MNVRNKNVFSAISSFNYKETYKEWKSSVCQGFLMRITLLSKSMIPTTLNYQNLVEPLTGSNQKIRNLVISTKTTSHVRLFCVST